MSVICLVGGLGLLIFSLVAEFPGGMIAFVLLALGVIAGWQGLIRSGTQRAMSFAAACVLLIGAFAAVLADEIRPGGLVGLVLLAIAVAASKGVFAVQVHLPSAPRPQRPIVVYNVKSGGGKAVKSNLADEAQARGITPRELRPGEDWEQIVRSLVADGFDGLMAAGGDGTQALVASIASEHDLPFACIPAGTRNHFALDLGVDRDDVVGALDAFVDGWEKRVDLGEVGGRVFVNNVSFGLYAQAVQTEGYREAKIRTILGAAPQAMAADSSAGAPQLRWSGPDGSEQSSAAVILVSNNVYRLGRVLGSGTRASLEGDV